jgi:hypothetical protein
MNMKKLTYKQKLDRVYAMAESFENQMDGHRMCAHEQIDTVAVLLARLMRDAVMHAHSEDGDGDGTGAVDDLLTSFALTLSVCTGPCASDDPMRGVKVHLAVSAADNEYVE